MTLPPPLESAVRKRLERFAAERTVSRIWERDSAVWNGTAETPELADRLGWLDLHETMRPYLADLADFADEVRTEFNRVVLLGMGGSSLAPEVLWRTFGRRDGFPRFDMLDSTHPDAVREIEEGGDLEHTLFLVASKSGTTVETLSFYRYFWERARHRGGRFAAITDPRSALALLAEERGFRRVFLNPPEVGGRYSALSLFGLVPAALIGIEPERLLDAAAAMARRSRSDDDNPAARFGAVLGEAALAGRDKLTLVLSPRLAAFGLWTEQLVAESTGKEGKGVVPVLETPGATRALTDDRLVVAMAVPNEARAVRAEADALAQRGVPVLRSLVRDPHDIAAEFFGWEFATAVAGAVLGVNPFDQPNVAESKANTKRVLESGEAVEAPGRLRRREIAAFVRGVEKGDYVAVLGYLAPGEAAQAEMARTAQALADRLPAAVTTGYGPRYLHSTGQLHKGGPPRGHFVQLLDRPRDDLAVPGEEYTFGRLLMAQAMGDRQALERRGRRVVQAMDVDELLELL